MKYLLCVSTIFLISSCGESSIANNSISANVSIPAVNSLPPWQHYLPKSNGQSLLDFSAVGVNYSESGIPTLALPIFNVVDFGAIPNDEIEDLEGIQKTIAAAEKAGGGIVKFPEGRFLINEVENRRTGILISTSRVILQGSGNSVDGTDLFMKYPLAPQDPQKKWTVPAMIKFQPHDTSAPSSKGIGKYIAESVIVEDAKQNDTFVLVQDTSKFNVGDVVTLDMQNPKANDDFLEGKQPRDIWEEVIDKGVRASEILEIKAINDNKIFFKQPLITRINKSYGWKIRSIYTIKNVGIENLRFTGNFKETFAHHKNTTHDSGFTAVNLNRTTHSWVQNVVFRNVSVAASVSGGIANTMMLNVIEGNRGHACFNITFGTRNLTALNIDITNKGQWHGPGASHLSVGNVIWRFNSPKSRGIDSHGLFPRFTLYDNVTTYGFGGWGGNFKNLPNHLEGLVLWNFVQTGDTVGEWHEGNFNFWDIDKPKSQPYTFFTAVNPILIGYEGSASGVVSEHMKHVNSFGKNVDLVSLYESQLQHRIGHTPSWITRALSKWQRLLATYSIEN